MGDGILDSGLDLEARTHAQGGGHPPQLTADDRPDADRYYIGWNWRIE